MRKHFLSGRFGHKARFLGMAILMVAGLGAMGGLVMLLWNWLMPSLFLGAREIGYLQALGLLLLCKLLFGGGRGHGHWHHWHARHHHWESMTPEERAKFQERLRSRWGSRFGHDDASGTKPQDPAA